MNIVLADNGVYDLRSAIARSLYEQRASHLRVECYPVSSWVEVTHQTKATVMSQMNSNDLRMVGCENPDIYVHKKNDDRIVLTRPQSLRNTVAKSKKHITSIRASDLFGNDWLEKLNILKFEKLGVAVTALATAQHRPNKTATEWSESDLVIAFIYLGRGNWLAAPL